MNLRGALQAATVARATTVAVAALVVATAAHAADSAAGTASSALAEDIRDIRGPKLILPVWLIPAVLIGLLLLALAGYALWRWWRGRRKPRVPTPYEAALAQLEALRAWLDPVRAREFSIAVSDIVRRYIEQRFAVTATHQTTEEFLRGLLQSREAALASHAKLLATFLEECDLVKFAGVSLTRENMESLHDSARAFVLETKESVEPHDAVRAT